MVSIDTHPNHTISWVDLAAKDVDEAVAFYQGLFGWNTFNDGTTPYTIFQVGEAPVAGVMQISPEMAGMPPVWSTYIAVENADATIEAVTAAGGSVFQPPFDIPNGGRIAVIGDPAGAAICIFEGMNDNGMKLMDENGAPCWFDCMTRDPAAAEAFYATVFGWTSEDMPGMDYTVFSNDGQQICGMMAMPDAVPSEVPSHWIVDFVVPDCDAAVAYATENGAMVTMPPTDTPFGRSAGLVDPWGAVFSIIDRSSATGG